jgi:hypothetical protein
MKEGKAPRINPDSYRDNLLSSRESNNKEKNWKNKFKKDWYNSILGSYYRDWFSVFVFCDL